MPAKPKGAKPAPRREPAPKRFYVKKVPGGWGPDYYVAHRTKRECEFAGRRLSICQPIGRRMFGVLPPDTPVAFELRRVR
jgi:hypothetical protein